MKRDEFIEMIKKEFSPEDEILLCMKDPDTGLVSLMLEPSTAVLETAVDIPAHWEVDRADGSKTLCAPDYLDEVEPKQGDTKKFVAAHVKIETDKVVLGEDILAYSARLVKRLEKT